MVTKKIRTEYMKKFRDPRWEMFSQCYEDSLRYRLTRRVMEHSHKPWFWEGREPDSDSSGWSTPRLTRNRVVPLSLPPTTPPTSEERRRPVGPKRPPEGGGTGVGVGGKAAMDAGPTAVKDNDVNESSGGSVTAAPHSRGTSDCTETDNGPAETLSSDGEPPNPTPRRPRRRRHNTHRPEPKHRDGSREDKPAVVCKPPRAKSQPPISAKENRRPSSRLDWAERRTERNTSDVGVQTRRESSKRTPDPDRRRARSADLEKTRRSQLSVADDRWTTEYMRCFSARLR